MLSEATDDRGGPEGSEAAGQPAPAGGTPPHAGQEVKRHVAQVKLGGADQGTPGLGGPSPRFPGAQAVASGQVLLPGTPLATPCPQRCTSAQNP